MHEKPLNFSIKTYLKNYLSKTDVFDIITVSAREQTRQPRGREGKSHEDRICKGKHSGAELGQAVG